MTRAEILAEASRIVTTDRNNQYGEPENLFGLIAAFWSTHLDHPVSAHDVAVMMGLMKCARMKANPQHTDSAVDACGYMAIAGEIAAGAAVRPAGGQVGHFGCPVSSGTEKAAPDAKNGGLA